MSYLLPIVIAYIVYRYVYRKEIIKIENRINNINKIINEMEKEDIIIGIVRDLKADFTIMRGEVSQLSKEVSSLKTKAGTISFIAAGVASGVISFIFKIMA